MKSSFSPIIYFLSVSIIVYGALQKILHNEIANNILQVGFILAIIFTGFAVYEIMRSKNILLIRKIFWVTMLILFNCIAGFIYIVKLRDEFIKQKYKPCCV